MNSEYIETSDVINRYVLGHLSDEELVTFELYYLEHPEVLEEIELTRALQSGLEAQAAVLANPPENPGQAPTAGLLETVASWFQNPAVLAGNFALIGGLLFTVAVHDQAPPLGVSADRVWVGDVRGERAPVEIEVRSASLVLDIDVAAPGNYSVSLLDDTGKPVTRVSGVEANSDAILVVFDASRLTAGTYRLNVDDPDSRTVLERDLVLRMPE